MAEFVTTQLAEVASVRSGYAFKSSDWKESGTPVVKIANVKSGRLSLDGCSFVNAEVARDAREFQLASGDILIAMTGYIGEVAVVRETDLPALLNQRVGRFSIKDAKRLDRRFLYYAVTAPNIRQEIEGLGYGSAQPNVSPSLIQSVKVPLPPIGQQHSIASVLGALDDKIELNRRTNETLEAMARAIFKDWFVDFGPTRAKLEGRAPYLAPDIWSLFPDRLDDEGKPEGWSAMPLDQVADFLNGLALQKYPANGGAALPVIKIAQLRAASVASADLASTEIPSDYVVENGDVLFSWSGSLLHRVWTGGRGALNQHLFKVTSKRFPKWFYFHWITEHMPSFQATAASKATTMGHIQRHHLTQAVTLIGSSAVMNAADEIIEPLFKRQMANDLESCTLAATRDLLLPKLMSGEVRLREASAAVGHQLDEAR